MPVFVLADSVGNFCTNSSSKTSVFCLVGRIEFIHEGISSDSSSKMFGFVSTFGVKMLLSEA